MNLVITFLSAIQKAVSKFINSPTSDASLTKVEKEKFELIFM
jgi:hypothetical protein